MTASSTSRASAASAAVGMPVAGQSCGAKLRSLVVLEKCSEDFGEMAVCHGVGRILAGTAKLLLELPALYSQTVDFLGLQIG